MNAKGLYRSILSQIVKQYESKNCNLIWRSTCKNKFQNPQGLQPIDAENILMYLQGAGEYNRLMALYWPQDLISEQEKIRKSAARVGLEMPISFIEESSNLSKNDLLTAISSK